MYEIVPSKDFQKSLSRIRASGKFKKSAEEILARAINILASGNKMPIEFSDHQLTGNLKEYRECHIKGDLLLIYQIKEKELILLLADIGSHSYLNL